MEQANDTFQAIRPHGFALWIGAGVSLHLATGAAQRPKLWRKFVEDLEAELQLAPPPDGATFPERLEACSRHIQLHEFQIRLRRAFLTPTAEAVVASAKQYGGQVPPSFGQISKLGRYANPIVNFNIEHMTSRALASAHGPMAIRTFVPVVPGGTTAEFRFESGLESVDVEVRFRRSVYHPHGALQPGGICVMTASQYAALDGTLALQLATHLAFDQHLLIVGMSLDDRYLRDQIERFRRHIRQVTWFGSEPPAALSPEIRHWVWRANVNRVQVKSDWSDFWQAVDMRLDRSVAPEPLHLLVAWHNTVLEAIALLTRPKLAWLELMKKHSVVGVSAAAQAIISALNSGEDPDEAPRDDLATQEQIDRILQPIRAEVAARSGADWTRLRDPAGYLHLRGQTPP